MVKEPICFPKNSSPSLLDVILTNKPNTFNGTRICDTGLSDIHLLVSCVIKNTVKQKRNEKTTYRSFKTLDETALLRDIENAPLHVADIFDDIDDVCWAHEKLLSEVIDEHIPVKERKQRPSKAPYTNGELRKEINYKKKLRRTFDNSRTTNNWNNFRIQRNKVTSLKRAAIRGYFFERCSGGPQSKDFWPTIKPIISKGSANSLNIYLLEDGNVVNDPVSVCNIFNDHFSKIANDIGRDLSEEEVKNHTSVIKIREHVLTSVPSVSVPSVSVPSVSVPSVSVPSVSVPSVSVPSVSVPSVSVPSVSVPSVSVPFVFKPISGRYIHNQHWKKESNGPRRSLRKSSQNYQKKPYLCHLTRMINRMFEDNTFPKYMKNARVTPIYKKETLF